MPATEKERRRALKVTTKFLVVRHPLDRLVSAYRNKFEFGDPDKFPLKYGRHIVRQYRENATEMALRTGADVTFVEFLTFLTREPLGDGHWVRQYDQCQPCVVKYDFIGRDAERNLIVL